MNLADVVRRVTERFRIQADAKGLKLEVSAPETIAMQGDQQRLEQLLSNLMQNSIRYTDPPGRIVVRATRRGTSAELVVEDSPPGVATQEYERLFDPLYRADKARSRKSGGSGLGLAIARAIAHAHGGTIAASPSTLGGLRLSAVLPIEP
jgi:two-component system sensor histidine kinase BaeS